MMALVAFMKRGYLHLDLLSNHTVLSLYYEEAERPSPDDKKMLVSYCGCFQPLVLQEVIFFKGTLPKFLSLTASEICLLLTQILCLPFQGPSRTFLARLELD